MPQNKHPIISGQHNNSERELLLIASFFGSLKTHLKNLRDGIQESSYSISCECNCETGFLFRKHHDAWVRLNFFTRKPSDGTIHFCSEFADDANQTNVNNLLFHELSHYFLGTNDSENWTFSTPLNDNLKTAQFFERLLEGGQSTSAIRDVLRAWLQTVFGK